MDIESNNREQQPSGGPTLQQAIDQAGSAVHLLWDPPVNIGSYFPRLPAEFVGWRAEQDATVTGVALSDKSHHMRDLFVSGPDATRLLADISVNNYTKFAIDQAKQFVAVNEEGQLVADAILLRTGENEYTLTGTPPAANWVLFHAGQGDYDVSFVDDPDSNGRPADVPPLLFRLEVQGPRALELVDRVFGGPLPETKFFHSTVVTLDGRSIRALRHGMTGQPGYEFIGAWADEAAFRQSLLTAGEEVGLVQVGAMAYGTFAVASGWIALPTPAIYTDSQLKSYREWLKLASYEGHKPLTGSFFSEDIEDYYLSPYEVGYGKSISLSHQFIGRDALASAKDEITRTKVTLVVNNDDLRELVGTDSAFISDASIYRIEADGKLIGFTQYGTHINRTGENLYLSVVSTAYASPGTAVTLVYGKDPGFARDAATATTLPRLRATVQSSPYDQFARDSYRRG